MKPLTILSALSGLAMLTLSGAARADDVVLEPSSDWRLREYDDKCRMSRRFGADKQATTLWIDQGSPRQSYNVTLIGRPVRHPYGPNLTVQFAPEPQYTRNYVKAKSSKGRPVLTLFGARLTPTEQELELMRREAGEDEPQRGDETVDLDAASAGSAGDAVPLDRVGAITQLRLGRAVVEPLTLNTGSLGDPLTQLQDCAKRLSEKIAVDTMASVVAGTQVQPTQTERWIPIIQKSYPRQMLRAEQEARLQISVTVDKTGQPSFCEVTSTLGLTAFNDTVCLLMLKHASFSPGRNTDGEPIVSRYSTAVSFVLKR
ncbi:MAG: energy transducer TonB [Pseudomonadota bacterium]